MEPLCLQVRNVEECVADLRRRGAKVLIDVMVGASGFKIAFIADPWGNLYELLELAGEIGRLPDELVWPIPLAISTCTTLEPSEDWAACRTVELVVHPSGRPCSSKQCQPTQVWQDFAQVLKALEAQREVLR